MTIVFILMKTIIITLAQMPQVETKVASNFSEAHVASQGTSELPKPHPALAAAVHAKTRRSPTPKQETSGPQCLLGVHVE